MNRPNREKMEAQYPGVSRNGRRTGLWCAVVPGLMAVCNAFLLQACSSSGPGGTKARTFADVAAALARMRAEYARSQLTDHPQESCITRDLQNILFYQLPMSERAVAIMEAFSTTEFDGEIGMFMSLKLTCRTREDCVLNPSRYPGTTPENRAYTRKLFRIMECYPQARVREFCGSAENYERYRKNLKHWKDRVLVGLPP